MSNILEGVIEEFKKISAFPRPSKYEFRVANYLSERLKNLGAKIQRDQIGNIIADFPATEGLENLPIILMQAHMDMVCVAEEGYKYDPLNDPIKLIRDEKFLSAEGTSLGADDGIGIAITLYILSNVENLIGKHGAWRIIFTVDEEVGMSGARELDKKFLSDVKYIINVDSENVDEIVIGSAGSARIEFRHDLTWNSPKKSDGYSIVVSGLKGGHSGESIDVNHANAIKILAQILSNLDCEINKFQGGTALNVIASEAKALITLDGSNDLKNICKKFEQKISAECDEPKLKIKFKKIKLPNRVMNKKETEISLSLINNLLSGVLKVDGDDKTSANIGIVKITDSAFYLNYMPRFHSIEGFNEIFSHATNACIKSRCNEMNLKGFSREWKASNSNLLEIMLKVAKKQKRRVITKVIHGGLECSHFIEKNPNLEIVSVGTSNLNIHSPNEKLLLSSVESTVNLIAGTLKSLAV